MVEDVPRLGVAVRGVEEDRVNPSPPVAVLLVWTGGRSGAPRFVPAGRALGWLAPTATVAVPWSVFTNVLPSTDQDGVQPGGTRRVPGTNCSRSEQR